MECYYDCCNSYRIASQGYAPCSHCECQDDDGYQEYEYFEHLNFLNELKDKYCVPKTYVLNPHLLKIKTFWEIPGLDSNNLTLKNTDLPF